MKVSMIEVELTPEQAAELEAAKGNPDAVETILLRIAEEAEKKSETKVKKDQLAATLRSVIDEIVLRLSRDVILCAHHLLHHGRHEEALMLVCPSAALIEREPVPPEVLKALMHKLDEINTERQKFDCQGNA